MSGYINQYIQDKCGYTNTARNEITRMYGVLLYLDNCIFVSSQEVQIGEHSLTAFVPRWKYYGPHPYEALLNEYTGSPLLL